MSYYVAKKNRCPNCSSCKTCQHTTYISYNLTKKCNSDCSNCEPTNCGTCEPTNCMSPFTLTFATTSSKQNDIRSSIQVYKTETQQDNNPNVVEQKGSGNIKKRGSGGNSYASYLAKKRGGLISCCNNNNNNITLQSLLFP